MPQALPFHYHIQKAEDIINRGGGVLVVKMYNKADDSKFITGSAFYANGGNWMSI